MFILCFLIKSKVNSFKMRLFLIFVVYYVSLLSCAKCAKILGILHTPWISHYKSGTVLMKILAEEGHEVTVVTLFRGNNPPKNYKEIVLTGTFDEAKENLRRRNPRAKKSIWHFLTSPFVFAKLTSESVENTLNHPEFKKLLNSDQHFDLVILDEFGSLALRYAAYRFNAPLLLHSALELNPFLYHYVGNPENPSYITHFHLDSLSEMNFLERLERTIHHLINKIVLHYLLIPNQNEALKRNFPNAPHINEFAYNVSLAFVNSDLSIHDALPKVPNIINIGGYHLNSSKALPKDLQDIMDHAEEGVIYFSLGTGMKSKFIPREKKEMVIRVLSNLKQTVLWKLEEEFPGLPKNVIIRKWFPQNDLLAHKNLKVFITHGGIYSLLEAINAGIPVLAFPIFGDQASNVRRAVNKGFARSLSYDDFSENEFKAALSDLLNNSTYTEAAKRNSQIMKDKVISPRESIIFWTNYVLRHKGADHLKVAAVNLSWYQYICIDVLAFIIACIIVNILILKFLYKLILGILKKYKSVYKVKKY